MTCVILIILFFITSSDGRIPGNILYTMLHSLMCTPTNGEVGNPIDRSKVMSLSLSVPSTMYVFDCEISGLQHSYIKGNWPEIASIVVDRQDRGFGVWEFPKLFFFLDPDSSDVAIVCSPGGNELV